MRAERAEAAVSRDAVAGVEALATSLVGAMDSAHLDVILSQSAGFLQVGAPGGVSAAIGRLLRTPNGARLVDDILEEIHDALDVALVDGLVSAFSSRICTEMGIDGERDSLFPERLVVAGSPASASRGNS